MKPSLMWALVWPNSNVNTTRGLCPRWAAQAGMVTRWNMSIKRHSPPRGRYVQGPTRRAALVGWSHASGRAAVGMEADTAPRIPEDSTGSGNLGARRNASDKRRRDGSQRLSARAHRRHHGTRLTLPPHTLPATVPHRPRARREFSVSLPRYKNGNYAASHTHTASWYAETPPAQICC
jgi:hypothetical protein